MEIVLGIALYGFVFAQAAQFNFSPLGWLRSWAALAAFSSTNLILAQVFGVNSGWISRGLLFLCLGVSFFQLKSKVGELIKFSSSNLALLLLSLFVLSFLFFRNFFPQFDVDSLNYHLPGVLWHIERLGLQSWQQQIEVISLWHLLIGMEEFLLVPGYGPNLDISLWGGVVGGLLKAMTVFSLFSLLPQKAIFAKSIAATLLLLDEHFLFSGLSRYVYITPSVIGLVLLLSWQSWRVLCSHYSAIWSCLSLGLLLSTVKYHGNIFLLGVFVLIPLNSILRRIQRKSFLPPLPNMSILTTFALSGYAWFVLHFWRWWETGSPIPPYKMIFFSLDNFWRGAERLENITFQGTILGSLNPNFVLRYPGIYSSQLTLLFLIPVAALVFIYFRVPKSRGVFTKSLVTSLFLFLFTYAWSVVAIIIRADESRYPRYVLGTGTLAVCLFLLSLRKTGRLSSFSEKIYNYTSNVWVQSVFALATLGLLFSGVDKRYRNVSFDHRPNQKQIIDFLGYYFSHSPPYLDSGRSFMSTLMMPLNEDSVPAMKECIQKLSIARNDVSLLMGNGILVFGPNAVWPSYLVAPHAAIGSISEGGGYLRIPKGKTPSDIGFQFAIIPKSRELQSVVIVSDENELLRKVGFDPVPICTTSDVILVKLEAEHD